MQLFALCLWINEIRTGYSDYPFFKLNFRSRKLKYTDYLDTVIRERLKDISELSNKSALLSVDRCVHEK